MWEKDKITKRNIMRIKIENTSQERESKEKNKFEMLGRFPHQ